LDPHRIFMVLNDQITFRHRPESVVLTTETAGLNSVTANYSQFLRKLLDGHDTC